MSQFSLTAEQMQANYNMFMHRIDELFPSRSEQLREMYEQLGQERILFAPASGIEYYHNAIPGGYVDHVLRVMDYARKEYEHYKEMGLDVSNFTLEELLFAAAHHDLGKLGFVGEGKESYVVNQSEWHRKNQGKMYESNEHIPFAMVPDRSLFLLQSFGIACTWNEYLAIKIHDGVYDKANESYYFAKQLKSKLRTNMPQILHNADMAATRYEFERWNNKTQSLNTDRLENSTVTAKPKAKATVAAKAKAAPAKSISVDDFDSIFNI